MITTLALRHVPFENLGAFGPVLKARGPVRFLDLEANVLHGVDPLAADVLVILGGPIGVYDDADYPWLFEETAFIARRLAAGLPTFGICLGAQLIAKALGAAVRPSGFKEIGFAPITLSEAGRDSALAPFAFEPTTLHWHGDTFDLPASATLLASTSQCANQAFSIGPNVLATQFHPEAGGPGFERWLVGHAVELAEAGIDPVVLRADAAKYGPALARKAERVITAWLEGLQRL